MLWELGNFCSSELHCHDFVSSTHTSPCCALPVRPHSTYKSEPTQTALWNARLPGDGPSAEAAGRNHRGARPEVVGVSSDKSKSRTSSTTTSPRKILPRVPPNTTTYSPTRVLLWPLLADGGGSSSDTAPHAVHRIAGEGEGWE